MRYMMFVLADSEPDAVGDDSDVDRWVDELDAVGGRLMGDVLDPSEARGVRVRAGERLVTDGPIPGVTDTLWGFDILECADLDAAIERAARHPMARNGRLELRPFPDQG
ncbi:MAG TPA: YciI family protein [Plantibacter sp.]|uniref:YciI family protein n=1 Tax=unclassified Plantibacter TaxID=2624265 RepID=UPI002C59F750|nr:YciI family protein [Plantibacter sp.]